ncbi:MAG: class I SAM-dependent methyltransferase [Thermomicrobiales bacterium]|nr:class I SAM-dependent methyltransferase [Thermomicrobiales bacterium]MCO5221435.1 class I SAM-dependent methyltransferase [Thermomicrobiales bacterium]
MELPEYVKGNRAAWDQMAADYVAAGERAWATDEVTWGIFSAPESEWHLLPDDLDGKDTIELGCGTAYVSSWLAKRGAKPVGIDNSPNQLETARRLQHEHGIEFPLLLGNAEDVPYPDESFDYAVSEYGAAIWCDPYKWIPEAARLLRPGGELMFLGNSVQLMICTPDEAEGVVEETPVTTTLERPLFGMHWMTWNDGSTEFHISHGERIRLLRECGFEVLDLVEIRPQEGATTTYPYVSLEWARQWPVEEVWKARKRS